MLTHRRTRAAAVVALAAACLAAPATTAAAVDQGVQAWTFSWEVLAPRPATNAQSTRAGGISATGSVLVRTDTGTVVSTPTASAPLTPTPERLSSTSLTRAGEVVGGGYQNVYHWPTPATTPTGTVVGPSAAPAQWLLVVGAPDRTVAGCVDGPYGAVPFHGRVGSTITSVNWPQAYPWPGSSFCRVGGIADSGVAVVTQLPEQSSFSLAGGRAATISASGVTYLQTGDQEYSAADAISPDGRYIVGRVGSWSLPDKVAFLSPTAAPQLLSGFPADFEPQAVTNSGQVIGVRDVYGTPRATAWWNGQTVDLTKAANAPAGWVVESVGGVNESGQIAATARSSSTGQTVAVRLTLKG